MNNRFNIILYVFIALFTLISIRLFYLASLGYIKGSKVDNTQANKSRHDILDRNGNVLAINIPSVSVYLKPYEIKDKILAKNVIIKTLGLSEEQVDKMINSTAKYVFVKRNITEQEELNIKYYGVIGINFEKDYKRFYPYNNLFSHLVGITDVEQKGISGLELNFNETLQKQPVSTSLDLRIQTILYDALFDAMLKNEAKGAYGMIVNPNTGEVLASVSLPDFNPNDRQNINVDHMFNYTTQGLFEFGSIAKLFSVAFAIDSKITDFTETYDVAKPIVVNPFIIVDFEHIDRKITVPEILMYSSNIGTSLLMRKLGAERQQKYLNNLNLLSATSLEIPEKTKGLKPFKWDDLTTMTISYGYGAAMTQASFMNGFIALVNNGVYKPLSLLKVSSNDNVKSYQVFSKDTSKQLNAMLRLTVAFGGGKRADIKGYGVAGKTGSSEKLLNGKYNFNKVLASFVAFFPYVNPQYAIIVTIDEPKRNAYNNYNILGGVLAAPTVGQVIDRLGSTFGIEKINDKVEGVSKTNVSTILKFIASEREK
jgi:cell division protein FtsI (penicillin-binding protein 3)